MFQDRIGGLLLVARQTFTTLRVGRLAGLQQVLIEPTTLIKGFAELLDLLFRWIDPVLKHFSHTVQLSTVLSSCQVFT